MIHNKLYWFWRLSLGRWFLRILKDRGVEKDKKEEKDKEDKEQRGNNNKTK